MPLGNPVIKEFCRLCQCHLGKIPISCNQEFIHKINEVTKIEVNDEPNLYLPMSACVTCFNKIMDIYSFIQTVQKVNKNLRDAVKSKYFCHSENAPTLETSSYEDKTEEILECIECPDKCSDKTLLNSHITQLLETIHFTCSVCSKTFKNPDSFNLHKKKHSELNCGICMEVFDTELEYRNHVCNSIVKKENESDSTSAFVRRSTRKTKPKFKMKSEILELPRIPERKQNFQCSSCSKSFSKRGNLIAHLKIHKHFVCTQEDCNEELPTAYALKIHKLTHSEKRPFLCVTCGKGFMTKKFPKLSRKKSTPRSNLRAHEKKYHEGVRFYCSKCTKEFLSKSSLDRHEKIHNGVKDFQCADCTSAFYTKKELLKHQKYHQ
ncbi:hypothetical protein NQ318_002836, partial [Aromia moschata]